MEKKKKKVVKSPVSFSERFLTPMQFKLTRYKVKSLHVFKLN